jgi:metallo-beta-lactamase family protein
MSNFPQLLFHGGTTGVTGSCYELRLAEESGILIDCGLFQGADERPLEIDFPVDHLKALLVTHVHIDHVGRIPYLLAAGFTGPIYCSEASAQLLPLVLEDAVKIGFTRDQRLVERFLQLIEKRIVAVPFGKWTNISGTDVGLKFKRAGHILGSAYIECDVTGRRFLFSGDLGAPYAPLLPAPVSPWRADTVILESTYGDRLHGNRRQRREVLRQVIKRAFADRGVILIPAFSVGRTQELLYELEDLIFRFRREEVTAGMAWDDLEIIVDSPLASRFTDVYRQLKGYWDAEAKQRVAAGRHPLSFEQLITIDSHQDHLHTVEYLRRTARPAIVIAGSGMCNGGRIVAYLKALLGDARTDVLFVGYQADGTPGRAIQTYGPRGGYVVLDGERYDIKAQIHTVSGYSAHADQHNLVNFIKRMRHLPEKVYLVHGDLDAKAALKAELQKLSPVMNIIIP